MNTDSTPNNKAPRASGKQDRPNLVRSEETNKMLQEVDELVGKELDNLHSDVKRLHDAVNHTMMGLQERTDRIRMDMQQQHMQHMQHLQQQHMLHMQHLHCFGMRMVQYAQANMSPYQTTNIPPTAACLPLPPPPTAQPLPRKRPAKPPTVKPRATQASNSPQPDTLQPKETYRTFREAYNEWYGRNRDSPPGGFAQLETQPGNNWRRRWTKAVNKRYCRLKTVVKGLDAMMEGYRKDARLVGDPVQMVLDDLDNWIEQDPRKRGNLSAMAKVFKRAAAQK